MSSASRASILQGLVAMSVNPLRSILSTLGIVIGVASVIATLALADGLEHYVREQIETQTDVQSLTVGPRQEEKRDGLSHASVGFPTFTLGDAAELQRWLGASAEVTMTASGQAIATSGTGQVHGATVTATLANYLAFGRKDVDVGRFFTDGESSRNEPVVVLSHGLAAEISPTGDPAAVVDRVVRLHGRPLTVVGVMPAYTGEQGYQVIIPVRAASMTFGAGTVIKPLLIVRAQTIESVDSTKDNVEEWLATRYRDWPRRVSVTSNAARLEQVISAFRLMRLTLGAFAAISLMVGGVGIMNVLLASVAERTREIGVRKALGARQRDILYQFLAESVAIAGLGSGVGTVAGFVLAFTVAAIVRQRVPGAQLRAAVTAATLLTSIVSAAVVGLTFGTFPALRAARLSPIDAIRHD